MISHEAMLWVVFGAAILILFALDLGVFHNKSHEVGIKEALTWSGIWLIVAIAFNLLVYFWMGTGAGHRICGRLPGGKNAQLRQSLRLPAHILLLQGAKHSPVQNPLLGHHRRPGHARHIHNGRHRADRQVPLDGLSLRSFSPGKRPEIGSAKG